MKIFDNYEISPCIQMEKTDSSGKSYFEVCEPHEADVWTLYGHTNGEGVQAIGDFATREHAEEIFSLITGIPFAESQEIAARLRVMHAGQELLDSLRGMLEVFVESDQLADFEDMETVKATRAAIAKATGRVA